LIFFISAGAAIVAAQDNGGSSGLNASRNELLRPQTSLEARLVNAARLAYLQKSEPDRQNSATPQANTAESRGGPPSQSAIPNAAGASPSPLTPTVDDPSALQARIQEALRNEPTLNSSHVTAAVTERTIELSGTVNSSEDKQTAERIASSFDGNRQLSDKLVVTGGGATPSATTPPQQHQR
jgi:hypothetical protein